MFDMFKHLNSAHCYGGLNKKNLIWSPNFESDFGEY